MESMRRLILIPIAVAGHFAYAVPPAGSGPATPPPAGGKPAEPSPSGARGATSPASLKDDLGFQTSVWRVLVAAAPNIDACTSRYTAEFPDRKGTATVAVKVGDDGRVTSTQSTSALQAPDRLNDCLATAARFWRFGRGPFDMTIPVTVAKGVPFHLQKPGEKYTPPAKEAPPAAREGFINFLPSWTQQE